MKLIIPVSFLYRLHQREINKMHLHHQIVGWHFATHGDRQLGNESDINQCSPNLNCLTIAEMLFPLVQTREMLTTAAIKKLKINAMMITSSDTKMNLYKFGDSV